MLREIWSHEISNFYKTEPIPKSEQHGLSIVW